MAGGSLSFDSVRSHLEAHEPFAAVGFPYDLMVY